MLSTAPLGTEVTVPAQRIGGPRGDFLAGVEHLDSTNPTNQQRGGSAAHWTRRDFSRDSWGPELSSPGEEGPICTTLERGLTCADCPPQPPLLPVFFSVWPVRITDMMLEGNEKRAQVLQSKHIKKKNAGFLDYRHSPQLPGDPRSRSSLPVLAAGPAHSCSRVEEIKNLCLAFQELFPLDSCSAILPLPTSLPLLPACSPHQTLRLEQLACLKSYLVQ
nr:uncharacterized protein LOC108397930 isoform X2 [Manis javanica]XP_036870711.1 uncharacterized protein LOC108397930 isoform X2 [Manis javanica]